jgi:hypothetical protein
MANSITPYSISEELDSLDPCGVECDHNLCDHDVLGSAYDAISSLHAAGVAVSRVTVESLFGAPFFSLIAVDVLDSEVLATVSRYWDIAEGLWDLLSEVENVRATA